MLFYSDTEGAGQFSTECIKRWLDLHAKIGRYRGQPALNSALLEVKPKLTILDDRFNAQFNNTVNVALKPVLWHYYKSSLVKSYTEFDFLVRDLLMEKSLSKRRLLAAVRNTHPSDSPRLSAAGPQTELLVKVILAAGLLVGLIGGYGYQAYVRLSNWYI